MGFFDKIFGNNQPTSTTASDMAASAPSKKILIVEDDTYLREFYAELLEDEGYEIITAENGYVGLDTVVARKPNLIITDLMMPVMDGKTMLHKIRELPEFKTLPIIVLTNAGTADNIKETTFYNNANDFLIKSNVQPEEIIAKVKTLLG